MVQFKIGNIFEWDIKMLVVLPHKFEPFRDLDFNPIEILGGIEVQSKIGNIYEWDIKMLLVCPHEFGILYCSEFQSYRGLKKIPGDIGPNQNW